MRWYITLERRTKNRLNRDITRRKLAAIAAVAGRNKSLGFEARVGRLNEPQLVSDEELGGEAHKYTVVIRVTKAKVRNRETVQEKFEHVFRLVQGRAENEGWAVTAVSGRRAAPETGQENGQSIGEMRPTFEVPALDDNALAHFFSDVYERGPHLRTIHGAVTNCLASGGKLLSHVLLYGLPGVCKTKLMERLKAFYEVGTTVERVLFVDGTTMTKAGLENWLLALAERNRLPEVLVVDELEKQPLDNLLCLNAVMGSGMLTRLNSRIGNVRVRANFVVVGICNDEKALRDFRNGALWSRFSHRLYCARPSRELCARILAEEVRKIPGGELVWAEKALSFGWDELGQRDVRELKAHLDGRERLMDGSWQDDQREILATHDTEIS